MQHQEQHLTSSEFLSDAIIGISDGLTVPFALAAGMSGAVDSTNIIITAGLAEIVAGCIAMGLGGYLAGVTEREHYQSELRREQEEVEKVPHRELQEVVEVFTEYGLSQSKAQEVALELSKDKEKWVEFMMRFELGLEQPDKNRAWQAGITIGSAYVIGGIIPLAPYFFFQNPGESLVYSSGVTVAALFFFGYWKSKLTRMPPLKGALRVTAIGVAAASAAYLIATLISS